MWSKFESHAIFSFIIRFRTVINRTLLLKKSFIIIIAFVFLSKLATAGWTVDMSTTQNDSICFGTVLKLHGYTNTGCATQWNIPSMVSCYPNVYATDIELLQLGVAE